LGQLEEKHFETSEQLKVAQAEIVNQIALADRAANATTIVEEKFKFFKGKYVQARAQLKEIKARATNYLRQLSFASWIQDSTWADGLLLHFETFQTWTKDPARNIDLDEINGKDIHCPHCEKGQGEEIKLNSPGGCFAILARHWHLSQF
jgi:hypothetical protein